MLNKVDQHREAGGSQLQGRVPWACPLEKHWNLGRKETPGEFRYLQITICNLLRKGFWVFSFVFSDADLNVSISFIATVGIRYNLPI